MSLLNVCTSANLNFWISGNRDLPSLTGWCSVSLWLLSSASVTKFRLHMRQRWRFVLCLVWSRLSDYKYKTKYIKVNILVIWQKSAIKKTNHLYFFTTQKKKFQPLCVFLISDRWTIWLWASRSALSAKFCLQITQRCSFFLCLLLWCRLREFSELTYKSHSGHWNSVTKPTLTPL